MGLAGMVGSECFLGGMLVSRGGAAMKFPRRRWMAVWYCPQVLERSLHAQVIRTCPWWGWGVVGAGLQTPEMRAACSGDPERVAPWGGI